MADIAVTATQVALLDPRKAEILSFIATEAIEAGQAVYILSTGKAGVAGAATAGKQQARGLALNKVAAGQPVDVVKRGAVAGFTLSGQNADTRVFLSNTLGAVADAAGTASVPVGRVMTTTDKSASKFIYFDFSWTDQWS